MRAKWHYSGKLAALVVAGLLLISGCTTSDSANSDADQVVHGLLKVLTSDNHLICLDSTTRGESLAIFRSMSDASAPAWRAPAPLRLHQNISAGQIVRDEIGDDRVTLAIPGTGAAPLPMPVQLELNSQARGMSLLRSNPAIALRNATDAPFAHVHWWLVNRLSPNCGPIHTVGNPVIEGNSAFVSVAAGHEGSIYAFQKANSIWTPQAKWSNWLY